MTSISSNNSSNALVLANIRKVNAELNATQNRISSGLKVASAKDNATVWATAVSLRSEISKNDALRPGIAAAQSIADSGTAALSTVSDLTTNIKTIMATVSAAGVMTTAQMNEINALQTQIKTAFDTAFVGGKNILTDATNDAVTAIGYDASGTALNATYTKVNVKGGANMAAAITAISAVLTSSTTVTISAFATSVDSALAEVTAATTNLNGYSAQLSSASSRIETFNNIRQSAVSALVDADMEEESARLTAIQTRQQLSYQALSISNSTTQNILRLFQ